MGDWKAALKKAAEVSGRTLVTVTPDVAALISDGGSALLAVAKHLPVSKAKAEGLGAAMQEFGDSKNVPDNIISIGTAIVGLTRLSEIVPDLSAEADALVAELEQLKGVRLQALLDKVFPATDEGQDLTKHKAADLLAFVAALHRIFEVDEKGEYRDRVVAAYRRVIGEMERRGMPYKSARPLDEAVAASATAKSASDILGSVATIPEGAPVEQTAETPDTLQGFLTKYFKNPIPIYKMDNPAEDRYVLGVVLEPNDGVDGSFKPDADNDIYSARSIEEAAWRFMEEYRNIGEMHSAVVNDKVRILESYIARDDMMINGQKVLKGSWLLGIRVLDDGLWTKIRNGEYNAYSIGGSALRTPAEKPKEADNG